MPRNGGTIPRFLSNVEVVTRAQIIGVEGDDGMLRAICWREGTSGNEVRRPIRHLFLFIGAEPGVRIEANIIGALQFVGSGALLYQLIWFAHLLKHPQASHGSGPGIAVELKHRAAPKHMAPVEANAT
jgi:hypothetical protein